MPEDPPKPDSPDEPDSPAGAEGRDRDRDRGLSDFVRRAVAAGFEAAGRSKEDIVRIATGEIRDWLDRLELDTELRKALSGMVLEVKAEIRVRPADGDALGAEAKTDIHVRKTPRDPRE